MEGFCKRGGTQGLEVPGRDMTCQNAGGCRSCCGGAKEGGCIPGRFDNVINAETWPFGC